MSALAAQPRLNPQPRVRRPAGAVAPGAGGADPSLLGLLAGLDLPPGVVARIAPRARRMRLVLDAPARQVTLALPPRAARARAQSFLDSQRGWIEAALKRLPAPVPFVPGALLPIDGTLRRLVAVGGRGAPELTATELRVPGPETALAYRAERFLRAYATERVRLLAAEKAARLGLPAPPVRVADTRSRWGSCTHDGRLMLAWRLIFAPTIVLDDIVAHEVAHLVEGGHGPAFWRLADALADRPQEARAWLKRHGAGLWRYGAPDSPAATA